MFSFNSKYASSPGDLPTMDDKDTIFTNHPDSTRRLYHAVPKLILAVDLETTGLNSNNENGRPISYGMAVYRNGIYRPDESHHFLADYDENTSPLMPRALDTHGIKTEQTKASYVGAITKDMHGNSFSPALSSQAAATKAMDIMAHYQKQGAVLLNHNLLKFDLPIIEDAYHDAHGYEHPGFDSDSAYKYAIDTMHHAQLRKEGPINPKTGKTINNLTALCRHKGINEGGHTALEDAKAATNLFFSQVRDNINEGRPSMMSTRTIRKTGSVGPSGINYGLASPCTKKKDCNFCKHLDKVSSGNRDETGMVIDKDHHEIIKNVKKMHQDVERAEQFSPKLVLTAQKLKQIRENNA